jgi:hypothetical protein
MAPVTTSLFQDLLKRLISGVDHKIFFVDGHPTHQTKLVTRFVADPTDQIELFVLLPYSAE